MIVIGHQGASGYRSERTLVAQELAIELAPTARP
jgi:glycerophosphoryl diester phosphodiesterase